MKRKSYHHGHLREALIAAGVRLLARKGMAGLSLRTLARGLGVSPAAPYRHFAHAGELAQAIAAEGFGRLRAEMVEALADPALGGRQPLERIGVGYLRFVERHPEHFRLMFSGRLRPKGEAPDDPLRSLGAAAFGTLVETIVAGQQAGQVEASLEPATLAVTAWACIHGFATLTNAGLLDCEDLGPDSTPAALAEAGMQLLSQGWGARPVAAVPAATHPASGGRTASARRKRDRDARRRAISHEEENPPDPGASAER